MLGWWICIELPADTDNTCVFATWETGLAGADWIAQLCQQGKARVVSKNGGYPDIYETQAKYITPWLLQGQVPSGRVASPMIFMETDDESMVAMNHHAYTPLKLQNTDKLQSLPPQTALQITVFDLS